MGGTIGQFSDRDDTTITGGTDGTSIGNTGDKLRVDASGTTLTTEARQEPNNQIVLGNGYVTVLTGLTVGSTEANVFYLKNNSGSKSVYIFNTLFTQDVTNGNNWMLFRMYYNPTVSANGSAATISNLLAGSSNTSVANAYTAPTVTSRGTLIKLVPSGINNAAAVIQDAVFPNYFVIPPTQSVLVTGIAKANGQAMGINLMWFEV